MYKVFFNESAFLLTDDYNSVKNTSPCLIHKQAKATGEWVCKQLEQNDHFNAVIYHPDIQILFHDFCSIFRVVGAAGGVVEKDETILMIKRLGMYDLPKGHIEAGESPEECAVREVEEECGIRNLHIIRKLDDTWHIYYRNNEWHLKQTFWYAMECSSSQTLIPQTEEDIEEVFWLSRKKIPHIMDNTYASLRPILKSFKVH